MRESTFETIVGVVVLAIAAFFLMFSLQSTEQGGRGDSYELTAKFTSGVNGITPGTDVRMFGVKVGVVTDVTLDKEQLIPVVTLTVENGIELDEDTIAKVASDGFLGGAHIQLDPGGGYDMIAPGGEILDTRGSLDLGALLGEFATGINTRLTDISDELRNLVDATKSSAPE